MQRGRRIAFDYGEVRIGVASSDPDGILASPHTTLTNNQSSDDLERSLKEISEEINPICIYVGLPQHLSGRQSQSSKSAILFAELVKSIFPCEIYLVDERLTSISAASQLRSVGKSPSRNREIIDQIAAVTILESALAYEKSQGKPAGEVL